MAGHKHDCQRGSNVLIMPSVTWGDVLQLKPTDFLYVHGKLLKHREVMARKCSFKSWHLFVWLIYGGLVGWLSEYSSLMFALYRWTTHVLWSSAADLHINKVTSQHLDHRLHWPSTSCTLTATDNWHAGIRASKGMLGKESIKPHSWVLCGPFLLLRALWKR